MTNKTADRIRYLSIRLLSVLAFIVLLSGLASIALLPDVTQYLAWVFTGLCMMVAFLMIRRNILRRLRR